MRFKTSAAFNLLMVTLLCTSAFAADWPMAGADNQRTSRISEQAPERLKIDWILPIKPYISQKIQVICAEDSVFLATSAGLFAIDPTTGQQKWLYQTALPLGHSPTVKDGICYVGCFDRRLHAVDAKTGKRRWTSQSTSAGFQSSPIIVKDMVIANNRDGNVYAFATKDGSLKWTFKTNGPVLFSPAEKDGIVYVASNDARAYAIKAQDGKQIWRSDILPGSGFNSWWPVIVEDRVLLYGALNYTNHPLHGIRLNPLQLFRKDVWKGESNTPVKKYHRQTPGKIVTPTPQWARGRTVIDFSKSHEDAISISDYYEKYPYRRVLFVLDRKTGKEVTYDFDEDGKKDYAPIIFAGTQSGCGHPPVIGPDGLVYLFGGINHTGSYIPRGEILGWKLDTPYIMRTGGNYAIDEPVACAIGGNRIYHSLCCGRISGFVTIPEPNNTKPAGRFHPKWWSYSLHKDYKTFHTMYWARGDNDLSSPIVGFGGKNGAYGLHGDQNPPIPYKGRVYVHRYNHLIALEENPEPRGRAKGEVLPVLDGENSKEKLPAPTRDEICARLTLEIEKMIAAGHLRPGYLSAGFFDLTAGWFDNDPDYFHNPAQTISTLLRARKFMPAELQTKLDKYIKSEFEKYPPYEYLHIGWKDGKSRDAFILPDDVQRKLSNVGPKTKPIWHVAAGWQFPPYINYTLWQYAKQYGLENQLAEKIVLPDELPPAEQLEGFPSRINAWCAGLYGAIELKKAVGDDAAVTDLQKKLDTMLAIRKSDVSLNTKRPKGGGLGPSYGRARNVSRPFKFMTPELAQYLRENSLDDVKNVIAQTEYLTPYWFVSRVEEGLGETVYQNPYDMHVLFQARAMILQPSFDELVNYLDVGAFTLGDLFYIDNLCALLETEK